MVKLLDLYPDKIKQNKQDHNSIHDEVYPNIITVFRIKLPDFFHGNKDRLSLISV